MGAVVGIAEWQGLERTSVDHLVSFPEKLQQHGCS